LNKAQHFVLWLALSLSACAPNRSSSTGVGNPGVISLSIVLDDEFDAPPSGIGGATGDGGASGVDAQGGAVATAGADSGVAADAGGATGASEPEDDPLPRMSVQHALLVLGSVRWLPCDTTLEPVVLRGPFSVDLLGNVIGERTQPPIPAAVEPEGGFCALEAPLAPGRSLFFDGVRSDGTPFVLDANVEATLRVRRHDSSVWNAEMTPAVLWAFRPRRWLSRMALDQTPPMPAAGEDGAPSDLVVDVNRHPPLLGAVRRGLAGNSSLFRDLNENRRLDPEDRDALVGDGSDDPD
jgi:hypothetical protein